VLAGSVGAADINSVGASAVKTDSANIYWDSTTAGTSQVEYGPDTAYGQTASEDGLSFFHETPLSGLAEGTPYHYRIRTRDYYGAETVSSDYTFTTRTQSELEAVIKAARQDGGLPKTYYVKTDGNNNADGLTVGTAWRNPAYAAGKADVGDTICLSDGTWTNEQLSFLRGGIDVAPITLTTLSGQRTATLKGINYSGNAIALNFKDYFKVENLVVRDYQRGIIYMGGYTRIYNCDVGNCASGVLGVDGHSYARRNLRELKNIFIVGNKIHDTAQTGDRGPNMVNINGANVGEGEQPTSNIAFIDNDIYGKALHQVLNIQSFNPPTFAGVGLSRLVFRGNEIHHLNYGGNAMYTIYGVAEKLVIEKNVIHDIPTYAIAGCYANTLIVDNNFYNNFGASIDFMNVTDHVNANNLVAGNTISNSEYGMHLTHGSGNAVFENCAPHFRIDTYTEVIRDVVNKAFAIRSEYNGKAVVRYTSGRVFSETGSNSPVYYPDRSEYGTTGSESVRIVAYPMTARPDAGSATVTVTSFDTSLAGGNTLVAFSATTLDGNNMVFAIGDLKAATSYQITRDGLNYHVVQSNQNRCIVFSNAEWPTRTFTVTETEQVADQTTPAEVQVEIPLIVAPNAPRSLAAQFTGEQVDLSWMASAYNGGLPVTNYKLYRGDVSGGETLLAQLDTPSAYTDATIEKEKTYYYQISAVSAAGEGLRSAEVSVLCAFPPALTVNDVLIYPNPYVKGKSQGQAVHFGNLPKDAAIYIYTLSGARIQTLKHQAAADGGSETWDVGRAAGGIYMVLIQSAQGVRKGKLCLIK